MQISSIDPQDTRQKLSLAYAMQQGYQVRVIQDGCGCVVSPDENLYNIFNFECDCPDAVGRDGGSYEHSDGRRFCKHVAYLSQVYPCECGSVMLLHAEDSWRFYSCCWLHWWSYLD